MALLYPAWRELAIQGKLQLRVKPKTNFMRMQDHNFLQTKWLYCLWMTSKAATLIAISLGPRLYFWYGTEAKSPLLLPRVYKREHIELATPSNKHCVQIE